MAAHSSLTGADLHEPKGASAAAIDTIYISDGAGSGTWTKASATNTSVLDTAGVFTGTNVETVLLELYRGQSVADGTFLDISNAETVLIPVPFNCTVERINFILLNGITVANSIVTVTRSDGAAMGTQTITQAGSAEGTTFSLTPSGNNTLTYASHKYVKLVSDGGSTTACRTFVQMLLRRI
jgi:hypothetical protein